MNLISSTDFGVSSGVDIYASEYAVVQQAAGSDIGMLAVVVALRGLNTGAATRELRIYLDGLPAAGQTIDNIPANQSERFFPETLGAAVTRLAAVVPAVQSGATIDVRLKSSHSGDTAVAGTCRIFNLDVLSAAQVATLLAELHLAKAALVNKQVQTIATGVVQIKDDDGTTPLRTLTPSVDDLDAPTQNILTPS